MKALKITAVGSLLALMGASQAQSPSTGWNNVYGFGTPAAVQQRLTQADLVAKGEAGYYDGLGRTVVTNNVFSSYSVGSINQNTTTVSIVGNGSSATVNNESYNAGNLNGSISVTDISDSVVSGGVAR
jgi:hypothetical protein